MILVKIIVSISLSFLSATAGRLYGAIQNNKPNIIFIMADDLGYGDLGCYGQEKIMTPNIDKLASEGMLFTQAYAGSSVCASSRSSLLTGFHNGHNRIRDNLPHGVYLRPDDFTIVELLKQAGYRTGGIGKWGLGVPGSWGLPNQQGFDYWYGHYNQDQAHFYYPDYLWENDRLVLLQEIEIINEVGEMVGNRGKENRLYTHLFVSYNIPHFSDYPEDIPEHYIVPSDEPYSDRDWPQIAKNYAAMITRMDRDVGKMMKLLEELQIEDNTLIIFTSDNGPYKGVSTPIEFFHSNKPLTGGKRDIYEGGIRIPFIAKWKDVVPEGTRNDKVIAFWDILPMFADLINYPDETKTDGVSIMPDLTGRQGEGHEYLYWDYGHVRNTFKQALRYGKYKMLSFERNGEVCFELYDLDKDPAETSNIAEALPNMVEEMKRMMEEAFVYTDDYPRKVKF